MGERDGADQRAQLARTEQATVPAVSQEPSRLRRVGLVVSILVATMAVLVGLSFVLGIGIETSAPVVMIVAGAIFVLQEVARRRGWIGARPLPPHLARSHAQIEAAPDDPADR
jgi:hypothetical protein